jgi:hypothetical protein
MGVSFGFCVGFVDVFGFDVSNYQPPEANLEQYTKRLKSFSVAALVISVAATCSVWLAALLPFYGFVMFLIQAVIAGLLLGVGDRLLRVRSAMDELILPYRVLWINKDWVWGAEVEKDFRCCGFDATAPSPAHKPCQASRPFCRTEIAAHFDRDVMDMLTPTVVIGSMNAGDAILWLIVAIYELCREKAVVAEQPHQEGEETDPGVAGEPNPYSGAHPLEDLESLSSSREEGMRPPHPEVEATVCQESVPPKCPTADYPPCQEAVLSP